MRISILVILVCLKTAMEGGDCGTPCPITGRAQAKEVEGSNVNFNAMLRRPLLSPGVNSTPSVPTQFTGAAAVALCNGDGSPSSVFPVNYGHGEVPVEGGTCVGRHKYMECKCILTAAMGGYAVNQRLHILRRYLCSTSTATPRLRGSGGQPAAHWLSCEGGQPSARVGHAVLSPCNGCCGGCRRTTGQAAALGWIHCGGAHHWYHGAHHRNRANMQMSSVACFVQLSCHVHSKVQRMQAITVDHSKPYLLPSMYRFFYCLFLFSVFFCFCVLVCSASWLYALRAAFGPDVHPSDKTAISVVLGRRLCFHLGYRFKLLLPSATTSSTSFSCRYVPSLLASPTHS